MDLSKQDKLSLIDQQSRQVAAAIYNQVINKRVADSVHDAKMDTAATAELVRLEMIKDALNDLRKEVDGI